MPINRPDGRHWCDPASEQPDESGQWTCDECGTQWLYSTTEHGGLWERPEDREARLAAEQKHQETLLAPPPELETKLGDDS